MSHDHAGRRIHPGAALIAVLTKTCANVSFGALLHLIQSSSIQITQISSGEAVPSLEPQAIAFELHFIFSSWDNRRRLCRLCRHLPEVLGPCCYLTLCVFPGSLRHEMCSGPNGNEEMKHLFCCQVLRTTDMLHTHTRKHADADISRRQKSQQGTALTLPHLF